MKPFVANITSKKLGLAIFFIAFCCGIFSCTQSNEQSTVESELMDIHLELLKMVRDQNLSRQIDTTYSESYDGLTKKSVVIADLNRLLYKHIKRGLDSTDSKWFVKDQLIENVNDPFLFLSIEYWHNYLLTDNPISLKWLDSAIGQLDVTTAHEAYLVSEMVNQAATNDDTKQWPKFEDASTTLKEIGKKSGDSLLTCLAYLSSARNVMLNEDQHSKALSWLDSASLYTPQNNKFVQTRVQGELLNLYLILSNYEQAAKVLAKINSIKSDPKEWRVLSLQSHLNALYHASVQNDDSSLLYAKRTYNIELNQNPDTSYSSLSTLALAVSEYCFYLNEIDSSIRYWELAKSYLQKVIPPRHDSWVLLWGQRAKLFEHQNNLDSSFIFNTRAADYAAEHRLFYLARRFYTEMAEKQMAMGLADKSTKNYLKATTMSDSFDRFNADQYAVMLEIQEKNAEQRAEIHEMEVTTLNTKRRNIQNLAIMVVILLVIILTGVILRSRGIQRRKQVELIVKEQRLALQEKENIISQFENEISQIEVQSLHNERKRIAAELHDGLLSELAGIVQISNSTAQLEVKVPELAELNKTSKMMYERARKMLHQLEGSIESSDDQTLFTVQLDEFVNNYVKPTGIKPTTEYKQLSAINGLSMSKQIQILYCCKEILANTLKHSGADTLTINGYAQEEKVYLELKDNGIGFDAETADSGIGLSSIRSRMEKIGGTCTIRSDQGKGSQFQLVVPT